MGVELGFQIALVVATFFCTLTTGFILIFAIVVMPGIGRLEDRDYLRAFQVIDGVIQQNQPIFILVWVGSALFLILSALLGFGQLVGGERLILLIATAVYLLGTQLPTVIFNIPLNNQLQALNLDSLSAAALLQERQQFEPQWNQWNNIRTAFAFIASLLLIIM